MRPCAIKATIAAAFAIVLGVSTPALPTGHNLIVEGGPVIPNSEKPCPFELKSIWDAYKDGSIFATGQIMNLLAQRPIYVQRDPDKKINRRLWIRQVLFFVNEFGKRTGRHAFVRHVLLEHWRRTPGVTQNYLTCVYTRKNACWDLAVNDGVVDRHGTFIARWDEIIVEGYRATCMEREPWN